MPVGFQLQNASVHVATSTGLDVVAAIALAKELSPEKTVVTVRVDKGSKTDERHPSGG